MRAALTFALASFVIAGCASAQPVVPAGVRAITVSGNGSASAPADLATLRIGITSKGETTAAARAADEAETGRVRGLLRAAGVADDQIALESMTLGEARGEDSYADDVMEEDPAEFGADTPPAANTRTKIERTFTARVTDMGAVDALMAGIGAVGGGEADADTEVSVAFGLRDPSRLRDEALRTAVVDARHRAELVAAGAGARVGPVVSIEEPAAFGQSALDGILNGLSQFSALLTRQGIFSSGVQTETARVVVVFAAE